MSDIFGGSFNIAIESGLDNTTFLANAVSVGESFSILDTQLTITNTSGLLLDPATHTLSEQLNFLALNTDSGLNGQYATIANLSDATTAIDGRLDTIETFVTAQPTIDSNQNTAITNVGLRLDTAEQTLQEHTNLISDLTNHLIDPTAHDATQIYFLSPGGGSATRGFFLSGESTTDSVYDKLQDTFTPTNAFKPDTSVHPVAFKNKIFVFSSDAGGSFVSTDGGLNFTALTTPWNINNLVTSAAVGEYTASGTFALLLGMASGEFYYTLDGINFILDPVTAFGNQILALTWTDYAEWDFVVHNDTTLYGFDWTGVSNNWTYANMPIEPTSIGFDVNGPIISSALGTYYYDWHTTLWTASALLGTKKVFFSHSGTNAGDYYTIAVTEIGELYTSFITNNVMDAYALVNTIVEAGTVTSLTQYETNKYLVTFGPPMNSLHQIVWFEYPFTFFHYQGGGTPTIRNLTGGCNAVYSSQLPASIDVIVNSGTVTCDNADEVIRNLNTANTEVRAAGYITNSALNNYRTASAQDTIDSGKYSTSNPAGYIDSSALNNYRTASAQDTIDSGKYSTSNPDGFITNNALTPYRTATDQDTIDSGKYSTSNPAGYITSAALSGYYPTSNPDNFVTLSAANSAYKSISSFNSDIANYRTANAQDVITGYLARNIRVVDVIHGVSAPVLGQAYSSIVAALTGFSGGTIFLYPGTHIITNTVQPIANVSFLGADKKTTIIQMTATTNISMFLINAANISFQNLTINLLSSSAVDLKMFEITAHNNTFHIDNVISSITQTSTGTSNIYAIHDSGAEKMTTDSLFHVFEFISYIDTTATGIVRNILKEPATGNDGDLHIESSQFYTNSGICVETAGTHNPELSLTNCFIQGTSADISQTTGRITLGKGTVLFSALSNNLPFNFFGSAQSWQFGDDGQLPGGTNYLYRGTATSSANLVPYRINKPTIVCNLYVNQRLAPGAGQNVVYTLMKNGVATTLTCTITNNATTSNDITHAVTFAAGDNLAMRTNNSGGTSADVIVQIDLY